MGQVFTFTRVGVVEYCVFENVTPVIDGVRPFRRVDLFMQTKVGNQNYVDKTEHNEIYVWQSLILISCGGNLVPPLQKLTELNWVTTLLARVVASHTGSILIKCFSKQTRLQSWPSRDQQVSHQRGIHCMQVIKHASGGSFLALKSRAEIIRGPKQGYWWPHKKKWNSPFF